MKRIISFVIILLMIVPVFAQRKKGKTTKPQSKIATKETVKKEFLASEIDETVESLRVSFLGNDIFEVYNSVKILPLKKSEFESTVDYTERVQKLSDKQLFGNLKLGSTLAFVYTPDKKLAFDSIKAEYDADLQTLSIIIHSDYAPSVSGLNLDSKIKSSSSLQSLTIFEASPRNLGSYIGVNSYGVRARIKKIELDQYEIVFPNCVRNELFSLATNYAKIDINIPPLEAVDLKYNLGILIIGKLFSPFEKTERILFDEPTIKNPTAIWLQKHYLFLEVNSMWIFSRGTGKIYKKIPRCSLKPYLVSESLKNDYGYFF